jgi:hypothetical protein
MSDRELAADTYFHPPEGGAALHCPAGTKESDLPDWATTTDDLFADPDAKDPLEVAAGAGDDGFTFGLNDPLFVESETDETEVNVPDKPNSPPRKTTRR